MYNAKKEPITVPDGANFFDLEKWQPYIVTMPKDVVTVEGRAEIINYLKQELNITPYWGEDWSWDWVVTKDESKRNYVGTLPKRISRLVYKEYNKKIPSSVVQELGNIARRNTNQQNEFIFELVDNVDWDDGDFGDGGSCFWTDYAVTKDELLPDYNGKRPSAVRFYRTQDYVETHNTYLQQRTRWICDKTGEQQDYVNSLMAGVVEGWLDCCTSCRDGNARGERVNQHGRQQMNWGRIREGCYAQYEYKKTKKGTGFARSWLACQDGDESFVMFNGYGKGSFQLYDQARVLATALGWTYKKISIDSEGTMYLNGDAIRVASPDCEKNISDSYHLILPHVDNYWCELCEESMSEEDSYWIESSEITVCRYCFQDNFMQCDECNDLIHTDDTYYIDEELIYVCERCYSENFSSCDLCCEQVRNTIENVDTGDYACQACADNDWYYWDGEYHSEPEDE